MMVQEIFVPALGMASTEVHLTEWVKQPGDVVAANDIIAIAETDKAEIEINAPAAGVLGRHRFEAGTDVPSGATIAILLAAGESEQPSELAEQEQNQAASSEGFAEGSAGAPQATAAPVAPREAFAPTGEAARVRNPQTGELEPHVLSPRQRSGVSGAASSQGPTVPAVAQEVTAPTTRDGSDLAQREEASTDRYRSAVAKAVARSWDEIPHFAVTKELRVERLQEVLRGFKAVSPSVTFTDVLLKAYALSLIDRVGDTNISLGLAVATPRGVAVPVLINVAASSVLAISRARQEAVSRAIDGHLSAEDATTPHSTLSNLGAYGIDGFTGIIPLGQTSILTVGAAAQRPVVDSGVLAVGTTMTATINVDHRVWDGQHAAAVLQRLAAIAGEPTLLLGLS